MYHKSTKTGKETGKMNKVITECAEQADKVLILTGTPLYNSKNDIIALYNMVRNPSTTPRISTPSDFRFDWLRCLISYYNPSSSSGDFPKRKDHTVRLKMTPDYVREYEEAVSIIKGQAEMGADSLVKKIFGGESKSMEAFHNVIRRAINNLEDREYRRGRLSQLPKITWVLEKIEDVDGFPGPIVVFSHFLEAGNRIIVAELRKRAKMRDIFDCLQKSSSLEILKIRIKKMFPDPLDKDIYALSPEELKSVPQMPGSLEQALGNLEREDRHAVERGRLDRESISMHGYPETLGERLDVVREVDQQHVGTELVEIAAGVSRQPVADDFRLVFHGVACVVPAGVGMRAGQAVSSRSRGGSSIGVPATSDTRGSSARFQANTAR
jgi:hypothetical protein